MDHSEKRTGIDTALRNITAVCGVTAACVVGPDGLAIALHQEFEVDTDGLGPTTHNLVSAANALSRSGRNGIVSLTSIESEGGLAVIAPLTKGCALVVIADNDAMLGAVRWIVKETVPQILSSL